MVYKVQGTAGPKKNDYFSVKKISSKLGVMCDITTNSLHLKPFVMHDVKTWSYLYSDQHYMEFWRHYNKWVEE